MKGKIALVGEAWGKDEEDEFHRTGAPAPFVGYAGRMLNNMLRAAGIERNACLVTNTFNLRPKPTNDVVNLCGPRAQGIEGWPALRRGKYIRREFKPELDRLFKEIDDFRPNLVITLGATPTWAFLKQSGIKRLRGTTEYAWNGYKVLPTYHPSAVNRQPKLAPIVMADLYKATLERDTKMIQRPKREVWMEPDLDDIDRFIKDHILPAEYLSIDIETMGDMITCIGFAPRRDVALVVPFYDTRNPYNNYWPTWQDEVEAWNKVRYICGLEKKIVFQNGLYDMFFLWRRAGIPVPHAFEDTMLLHHALQPEMEKGLAFLGSIYTRESSWKLTHKTRTVKKEE